MYRPDHPPPHLHAQYGDHVAQIELGRCASSTVHSLRACCWLVREWAHLHADELADNWERAQALEPMIAIEPLT